MYSTSKKNWTITLLRVELRITDYKTEYVGIPCRILRFPGERIVDFVPGGTEFELQVKTGSWAGSTHSK